jgi:hypothetical protein
MIATAKPFRASAQPLRCRNHVEKLYQSRIRHRDFGSDGAKPEAAERQRRFNNH